MKLTSRLPLFFSLALLAACAGCTTNVPTNANAPSAPTASASPAATSSPGTSASPAASAAPSPSNAEASMPVTLPVLDAMFSDSTFARDLKAKLQLSNEQIEQLRKVAREETSKLNEKEAGSGTTSEATRSAAEKIKGVIGEEKLAAFDAFVSERWSGGEGTLPGKPNSVPTDTRIVVNAPAFRMDVYQNGQLLKTYRVGIGYPEFPLPQGMRKAEQIIFNPTWTPPDEPWVKGKVQPGEKIEAGSKLNPLGPLKIPIGLPSLIHGGKNPARLGQFASHGCVGLTSPEVQDFAATLAEASGTQLTAQDIQNYAKNPSKTQVVKLAAPVPVELRYETIVVEDGKLHVYRDVYGLGTNTEDNLRRVLEVYGVRLEDLSEQERSQALDALKQMARDAHGNPTDAGPQPKGKSKTGNVTYNVKGDKEVVIEVAALRGKGYPAPVNLTPPAPQPKPTPAPKKRGK
ncbi:MAG: L,D-transpeptidase [Acidobacteriota bacterium]|nr:L,D-transpeptidase [Acidobacteriota bacterium]MDQ5836262.1 L,D-transpeptidase [Acidobacteriota bacterium]